MLFRSTDEQRTALLAFAETMGEGNTKSGAPVKDFFKKGKKK